MRLFLAVTLLALLPLPSRAVPTSAEKAHLCGSLARLAYNIGRTRDSGVSLDALLKEIRGVKGENTRDISRNMALMAYANPTVTPESMRDSARDVCTASDIGT